MIFPCFQRCVWAFLLAIVVTCVALSAIDLIEIEPNLLQEIKKLHEPTIKKIPKDILWRNNVSFGSIVASILSGGVFVVTFLHSKTPYIKNSAGKITVILVVVSLLIHFYVNSKYKNLDKEYQTKTNQCQFEEKGFEKLKKISDFLRGEKIGNEDEISEWNYCQGTAEFLDQLDENHPCYRIGKNFKEFIIQETQNFFDEISFDEITKEYSNEKYSVEAGFNTTKLQFFLNKKYDRWVAFEDFNQKKQSVTFHFDNNITSKIMMTYDIVKKSNDENSSDEELVTTDKKTEQLGFKQTKNDLDGLLEASKHIDYEKFRETYLKKNKGNFYIAYESWARHFLKEKDHHKKLKQKAIKVLTEEYCKKLN